MTPEQETRVIETLGRLDERSQHLVHLIEGDGMPGLKQRVEDLEASKNRTIGGVAVLGVVWTGMLAFLQYLFHAKK